MTTIYLIRHAQKASIAGDPGLTPLGQNQARETGEYLRQLPITKIFSSPYKRTRETAAEIAQVLQLEHTIHDALAERMNWDDPSVAWKDFLQEWVKATKERDYLPKYGDSSRQTGKRIQDLLAQSAENDEHIVLVSHGGAILDYLRNICGDEAVESLRKTYDAGEDYTMANCAITTVALNPEPELLSLNFHDHLSVVTE